MEVFVGVVGSLLGVVIGAFLTRWVDFKFELRREERDAIASALILREELRDMKAGIRVILKREEHNDPFLWEGLQAWEEHRERLLSKDISYKAWCELASIFRALLELAAIIKATRGDDWTVDAQSALEQGAGLCDRGLTLLAPVIGERNAELPVNRAD